MHNKYTKAYTSTGKVLLNRVPRLCKDKMLVIAVRGLS
jgi:hypothetical protein